MLINSTKFNSSDISPLNLVVGACHYSAFTEPGATQTMKTNQMAELKQ